MKILNVSEMMEVAEEYKLPDCEHLARQLEVIGSMLAERIAAQFGVIATAATFEPGFSGVCSAFRPGFVGQSCPDALHENDEGGDWP